MRNLTAISLTLFIGLAACSSVSEKIPTVKIERKKPKATQHAVYSEPRAVYAEPKVQKAEAAMVCENDNMRARAADKNMKNDNARVLILEEGGRSSNILADVEINCRDYFQSAHYSAARATTRPAVFSQPVENISAPMPAYVPTPSVKTPLKPSAAEGYFYTVRKGDTLYQIARENCTSVKTIARLNEISDPTLIDRGIVLRLPEAKCNTRN